MSASHRRPLAGLVLLLPLFSACSDTLRPDPVTPSETLAGARLACVARVREAVVTCTQDGALPPGARARILGGQGEYIRMASSGVAYAAEAFSFNATVQNLSDLPMGTVDGATRHADGVRAFLVSAPVATGGTGTITVANATGQQTFTAANQDYYQYGGNIGGSDQPELGADGILSPSEVSSSKPWQFNVPATVTTFAFNVYVGTETPPGAIATTAPQVDSASVDTLLPGTSVVLYGRNFGATPAGNTVRMGSQTATVTAASATQLTVTVPCVDANTVQVTQGGMMGAAAAIPTRPTQRTLAVGQAMIIRSAAEVPCNELTATGAPTRYLVTVYNGGTSPSSGLNFQVTGDVAGGGDVLATPDPRVQTNRVVPPSDVPTLAEALAASAQRHADARHAELMEKNAAEYERLRRHFANDPRMRRNVVNADPVEPPLTRQIRMANIGVANICRNYITINARRVFYNGKIAIYEDADSTPAHFQAANSATMQDYYNRIGNQFNADMEPVLTANFGDPLRRDAETDNNGVVVALFTPLMNTRFAGVAGFVVTCDQYPNDEGTTNVNTTSNFGEYFYAYQPTVNGTGYSSGLTPDSWYRTIRSTFIHETKHVVSNAARVENNATFESAWLEEGMARMSEEMWAREAVYGPMAWKGNHGYGSQGDPRNVYCDVRPSGWPECQNNTRAPVSIMQRHFSSQSTHLFGANARLLSPFGQTAQDNASYYYAISWSLIRYAVDRYGASDAAFLTALTQATTTGATNLAARAGVPIDSLLGGWAMALTADDYPGLVGAPLDAQVQTWNYRSIYAGLNADIPGTYTLPFPGIGTAVSFGSFAPSPITTIYGGGFLMYNLSGTQTAGQVLRLQANGGGALNANLRLAIIRVQ